MHRGRASHGRRIALSHSPRKRHHTSCLQCTTAFPLTTGETPYSRLSFCSAENSPGPLERSFLLLDPRRSPTYVIPAGLNSSFMVTLSYANQPSDSITNHSYQPIQTLHRTTPSSHQSDARLHGATFPPSANLESLKPANHDATLNRADKRPSTPCYETRFLPL